MILKILNQYIPTRRIVLILVEGCYILGILSLITYLLAGEIFIIYDPQEYLPRALLIVATIQLCLYYFELYDFNIFRSNLELTVRLLQSLGIASIILAGLYFFFQFLMIGRGIFLPSLFFIAIAIVLWRLLYNYIIRSKRIDLQILIVGTGQLARSIAQEIKERGDTGFKVIGFAGEGTEAGGGESDPSILGPPERMLDLVQRQGVDRIVVAMMERRGRFPTQELLECKMRGFLIEDGIDFYEHLTGKLQVEYLHPSVIIFSEGFRKSRPTMFAKRWLDVILSSIGLVLAFPILLLIALLIKLDSPGPVFYSQERSGKGGKPFRLIKLRSMRENAEPNGPVWAEEEDPRMTRVGRWLRKLRLDELPQLINVIRGEISFVGPRPERAFFIEQLKQDVPYYNQRLSVKPGVTGWAQINYPYGASREDAVEKLKYDLYYIKNMSIIMDLYIIFETVKIVLFGKGAR